MKYFYARVSTDGQSLGAQVQQLRAAGAEKVFRETASGARSDRAQLRRVLAQLDKGDVLTVARPNRLARSTGAFPVARSFGFSKSSLAKFLARVPQLTSGAAKSAPGWRSR